MIVSVVDHTNPQIRELVVIDERNKSFEKIQEFSTVSSPIVQTLYKPTNRILVNKKYYLGNNESLMKNEIAIWVRDNDFKNNQLEKEKRTKNNSAITFNHEKFDIIADMLKNKLQLKEQ